MVSGMKSRRRIGTAALVIIALALAVLCVLPMYALIIASFSEGNEILRNGLSFETLKFKTPSLANYRLLFEGRGTRFWYWFRSSAFITVFQVAISTVLSSMVGYAFGVYRFRLKNQLFALVLLVMMLPMQILILPLYNIMIRLGFVNSYWGVILPNLVSPLAVFFFRQYAQQSLPSEMLDSGRIDGCNEYYMFVRIMLPLMLPAFGAIIILLSLHSWNDFVWPLIILNGLEKTTLPVGINSLITPYGDNYDMLFSSAVFSFLPIMILFVFFQQYFVEGLTIGSVKG